MGFSTILKASLTALSLCSLAAGQAHIYNFNENSCRLATSNFAVPEIPPVGPGQCIDHNPGNLPLAASFLCDSAGTICNPPTTRVYITSYPQTGCQGDGFTYYIIPNQCSHAPSVQFSQSLTFTCKNPGENEGGGETS